MKTAVSLREAIAKIEPGQFMKLEPVSPGGTLVLRKDAKGSLVFYWRVTFEGKSPPYQIGLYDSAAPPKSTRPTAKGYSLNAARSAAADMAAKHYSALADGGYASVIAAEKAAVQAVKEAAAAADQTLQKLVDMYAGEKALRNRETAKQVRNLFAKNVRDVFPETAKTPANKVTTEQIATALRNITKSGKQNTARKLKAYLHSAFEMAKDAEYNASVPEEFKAFKVKRNPVSDVSGISSGRGADKDPILPEELLEYWKAIDVPGAKAALARLHLFVGGQRVEQLVRLKNCDVEKNAVRLWDTKGRKGEPREIYIPLIPVAAEALKEIRASGEYALSVTEGKHLSAKTALSWVKELVGNKVENFQLKRVRSGVTTVLAKLKVDKEVRDHLQSHNLSGIEHRHYNAHDFFDEKKKALTAMHDFLASNAAK
ncbi:hypothetical protein AWV79_27670 [Cupriavidus sp. UYMMa02A]|nr:hypothetical protein AWV79_27670 [Cupriavidus sp. UYMMa02A]